MKRIKQGAPVFVSLNSLALGWRVLDLVFMIAKDPSSPKRSEILMRAIVLQSQRNIFVQRTQLKPFEDAAHLNSI
jgi:hypothetical protein